MTREHTISSRTFAKGALVYTVSRIADYDADLEDLTDPSKYKGEPAEDIARYVAEDQARRDAYDRGDWQYLGIACDIRCQTPANWADGGAIVGRASVWGIESDSDEEYLVETEAEMIEEAEAEVQALVDVLTNRGVVLSIGPRAGNVHGR